MKFKYILTLFIFILIGCSFYSFKGSIPAHIKSVHVSPIKNNTIESSASDIIKTELQKAFINENILKLLPVEMIKMMMNLELQEKAQSKLHLGRLLNQLSVILFQHGS